MYRDSRKGANITLLAASEELRHGRDWLVAVENDGREPEPRDVVNMCNLYGIGKALALWHCHAICSVGQYLGKEHRDMNLLEAGMRLINRLNALNQQVPRLIEILEDGKITHDEIKDVENIMDELQEILKAAAVLEFEKEKAASSAGTLKAD